MLCTRSTLSSDPPSLDLGVDAVNGERCTSSALPIPRRGALQQSPREPTHLSSLPRHLYTVRRGRREAAPARERVRSNSGATFTLYMALQPVHAASKTCLRCTHPIHASSCEAELAYVSEFHLI